MKIFFAENQKEWDEFLTENDGSFLQSWDFGNFEKMKNKKVWRLFIEREKGILAAAQVQKEIFPMKKSLLYIPFGPCFKSTLFLKDKKKILTLFFKEIEKIGKKENSVFLNIEPTNVLPKMDKLIKSEKRVQPKETLILSLKNSTEEIFKNFHPKTRYNIRLAQKRGVEIKKYESKEKKIECLNYFCKLLYKTSKRGGFKSFSKSHYKYLLSLDNTILYIAKYKDKIIAANILIYFGKRANYIHGVSDYKYRKFMAPHLLHWKQISDAKNMGFLEYDFWGIDEEKWPGITRFKRGFGGEEFKYPKGRDFILKKFWYKAYQIRKKVS